MITGDGEMLMGMGSLATIGVQRPPNLAVIVFDNQRYGETGMQASHTEQRRRPRRRRASRAASRRRVEVDDEAGLKTLAGDLAALEGDAVRARAHRGRRPAARAALARTAWN